MEFKEGDVYSFFWNGSTCELSYEKTALTCFGDSVVIARLAGCLTGDEKPWISFTFKHNIIKHINTDYELSERLKSFIGKRFLELFNKTY